MARHPSTKDCAIKGCTRARFKGDLCRKHYGLVPRSMVMDCAIACIQASFDTAARHHRRQLAYVRKLVSSGAA